MKIEAHGKSYAILDPGGRIGQKLRSGVPYEHAVLEHTYQLGLSGTAVDVGAGVGNHTLWYAGVCGLAVRSFEPLDFNRLQANVDLNPDLDIVVFPCGLGDCQRLDKVTSPPEHVVGRALREEDDVVIRRLDDILFPQPVSLIKIDVEGMEPEVLRGARETILEHKPRLFVEAIDRQARKRNAAEIPRGYTRGQVFGATPLEEWVWNG